MLAARQVRALRGLMEALPVRVRIADHALADGFPVLLQLMDTIRERAGLERRSNERLHFLDQRGALGCRGVLFPIFELIQGRIDLLHLARERRWHERQRCELFLQRATQPRRASGDTLAERPLSLADQRVDLAQCKRFRRRFLRALRRFCLAQRGLLGRLPGARFAQALRFDLGKAHGLLACGFARGLFRRLGRLPGDSIAVLGDDRLAALDGPRRALAHLRRRLLRQALPSRMEMPESRLVNRVVDPVTVPLEGLTGAQGVAQGFGDLPLLGVERIAFLPDDLVDAFVLAAQLFEESFELRRVRHGLRRELTDAARGPLEDELGPALRILDRSECSGQRTRITAITRNRQEGGQVALGRAQLLEVQRSRIDQLREPLLRDPHEPRGYRIRSLGADPGERRQSAPVLELADGRRPLHLVPVAQGGRNQGLRRRSFGCRDRIRRRRCARWRFAK